MKQADLDFRLQIYDIRQKHSKKDLMIKRSKRVFAKEINELSLNDRQNFKLVSETLDKQNIVEEASRCLYCDEICNICTTVCPNFANYSYEITPISYNLQKAVLGENGKIEIHDDKQFEVKQKYQILNIANFCNECGNCNTFCPTSSAPYKEKPKVYLSICSFKDAEEGYYLSKVDNRNTLIYKETGGIKTLSEYNDELVYETDHAYGRFSKKDFALLEAKAKTPCVKEIHFEHAAIMSIVLQGVKNLVFE